MFFPGKKPGSADLVEGSHKGPRRRAVRREHSPGGLNAASAKLFRKMAPDIKGPAAWYELPGMKSLPGFGGRGTPLQNGTQCGREARVPLALRILLDP